MSKDDYTFEQFLRDAVAMNGQVRLVPRIVTDEDGNEEVHFYACVMGMDSETVDYKVQHDDLINMRGKVLPA